MHHPMRVLFQAIFTFAISATFFSKSSQGKPVITRYVHTARNVSSLKKREIDVANTISQSML